MGQLDPVILASVSGRHSVVQYLHEHGASLEAKDSCGRTSLFLASAKGRIEVMLFLLSHGAVVDLTDSYGSTLLFAAVRNGHEMAIAYLLKLPGAYVQFEDGFGETCFGGLKRAGKPKSLRPLQDLLLL